MVEPDPYQAPSPFALFDFKGRYGRVSYINAHLVWLGIFSCLAYFIIDLDFSTITTVFDGVGKRGPLALSYVLYSLLMMQRTVLRLHDLDVKGHFCFLQFVPVIGWFVIFFLIFAKGNTGPNEYGMAPDQRI